MSTAGTNRRYHRTLPSVMARTAARCATFSKGARAASEDRPSEAIEAIARAASARAGAPGAQGVLAKMPTCQLGAARKVRSGHYAATWPLQLPQGKQPAAALNPQAVVPNGDDRAGRRLNPALDFA